MTTVLVELDLVCDATVDGAMPVEVRSVDCGRLTADAWAFAADEPSATAPDAAEADAMLERPPSPAEE
ncbi:hypothetical protein SY89_02545 [Halolamina pelagica]|uniref:Uncharacterized protein n=1 Tax=Halolamina pelagica TaxID=699431 RepID=A0A0P7GSB5_9EURY|nr:hypothetical protein [Halolamina pelagica]KPN31792.1 hypothetical protein SY89_02545 [Halolamina pelagica]